MTEDKLNKAWELHDKIRNKKWYLEALSSLIENPKPIHHHADVEMAMGYNIKIVIPADIVKNELIRQAEELSKEIESLEREFDAL